MVSKFILAALTAGLYFAAAIDSHAQSRRHIKVVLQSQETGSTSGEMVQGSGGVVVRRGNVQPSGRITANQRQTTVQRSSGVFTLVLDGGEAILSVATRVPQTQIAYYHNYAARIGYIERYIVFNDVGTSLRVSAATLPDGHIQLRLTPRISYFSAERPGAIDFTEAATELIVPNGQPVSLGGSTTNLHELTRQILGYRERASSSEINLIVTATVQ
jgi:type II secretory pathway component GspD/PulD (secretin)